MVIFPIITTVSLLALLYYYITFLMRTHFLHSCSNSSSIQTEWINLCTLKLEHNATNSSRVWFYISFIKLYVIRTTYVWSSASSNWPSSTSAIVKYNHENVILMEELYCVILQHIATTFHHIHNIHNHDSQNYRHVLFYSQNFPQIGIISLSLASTKTFRTATLGHTLNQR
jgi:hypothetical protein